MTGADDDLDAMLAALPWRPIATYRREHGEVVAVRRGDDVAAAFHGNSIGWELGTDEETEDDKRACWRSAQESEEERPLRFEPDDFASLTPEQRTTLMAD